MAGYVVRAAVWSKICKSFLVLFFKKELLPCYDPLMQRALFWWITAERGRFVLFLPVFFGVGVLAYFGRVSEPSAFLALLPVCVGGVFAVCVWRWPLVRAVALCLVFGAAGFADAWWSAARAPPWNALPTGAAVLTGRVSLVEVLPKGRRITLRTPSLDGDEPLARDLRIRLRAKDALPVAPGDVVSVRALVRPPSPPDVPGGWDTQRDAFFAGLGGYGFAIGPCQMLERAPPQFWRGVRENIAGRILAALPGARGAIAATLLTGLGTAIPAADRAAFQDSGLAHLLAVAGLHIGIVMALVFGVFRVALSAFEYPALHWPTRRIAALAALAAGGLYLALTGGHLPIVRSFAMAALFTLGVLTNRRAISLRSLAFAAMLLLAWSPSELVGVGFQMSFAAVLALIASAEVLAPSMARLRTGRWWSAPAVYTAGLVLTSLVAGTASLPFAAYHFGRATLYYVPANVLAVPLTAFWVLPWGLAALALMPFGLEHLALTPMGVGIDGLLAIAHFVAAWPGAARNVAHMSPAALALAAAGMVWLGLWRTRLRLLGVLPILAAVPLLFTPAPDIVLGPQAEVIAARLGDTVLVEHARRATPIELEAPPHFWGIDHAADFPAAGAAADGAAVCDPAACRLTIRGLRVILLRNATGLPCGPLLVSAQTLRGACAGAPVADRALARRSGAVAIRLGAGGAVFVTDRDIRGDRPWVIAPVPLLPPAQTE
jgi:competence protein ComEC